MAVKNTLGKIKNMSPGAIRYALKKAEKSGNTQSKYYHSLKERLEALEG